MQKSRLVEKLAELIQEKKAPLLSDVRDEFAETVRLVLEPKSRAVDPTLLMESLFRLTELEVRFGLNMNVLSAGQIPGVLSLRDVLKQWLDHRQVVLVRRTKFRLQKIEHRLEVLDGYLIAYLNLDEVIRIVRFEDEPKQRLIARFKLTEVQADAILNLRLKALSKLEEVEIRVEHDKLTKERRELKQLLKSDDLQWERIATEIRETRERYGKKTELGRRRTTFADAPEIEVDLDQAMIEKEPITVILSEKGWIRALRGHQDDLTKLEFKQGDSMKRAVKASTTDRLLLFATNGKFFTLEASQLPGGRGHGEPVRLMFDLEENHELVELFVHEPGRKLLLGASSGHGFIVPEDEVVASTRKGKQVMNANGEEACVCVPSDGDSVACIGENRKMLVFPLDEVNEMTRGKGIIMQRYKDGELSDVRVFRKAEGLSWLDAAGTNLYVVLYGVQGLGRPTRPGRTAGAQGIPAIQQIRTGVLDVALLTLTGDLSCGERHGRWCAADGARLAGRHPRRVVHEEIAARQHRAHVGLHADPFAEAILPALKAATTRNDTAVAVDQPMPRGAAPVL